MSSQQDNVFYALLWQFFADHERLMPWRMPEPDGNFNAYKILVSELMLQQTQVVRVIPKYEQFLARFPNVQSLAEAPLADVLTVWQGLGYNRRAKYLWQAAQAVMVRFGGKVPRTDEDLISLPGIGVNTAGAVLAYAYDEPVLFIETNIRTVFIHHYFHDQAAVADAEIKTRLIDSLDWWLQKGGTSRTYYWALMDYGSFLKTQVGNASKQSKSYVRQVTFKGSKRQLRGAVLRALSEGPHTVARLHALTDDNRTGDVCQELEQEGLLHRKGKLLHLGV